MPAGATPSLPEAFHRFRRGRELTRGQQPDLFQHGAGTLGFRVELADALDLLVEQVEAQRGLGAHREKVDDGPAHRELAVRHDLADVGIAGGSEPGPEGVEVEP